MTAKFYGHTEIAKIAKKIWKGSYPKDSDGTKWCDAEDVGIDLTRDYLNGISREWSQVDYKSNLEMKIGGTLLFGGRIYVRKMQS